MENRRNSYFDLEYGFEGDIHNPNQNYPINPF